MTEIDPKYKPLFRLQQFMWYLFAGLFGAITAMFMLDISLSATLALWTTVTLLILTASKLIYIAREFKRARMALPFILTVLLLLVLISIALLKA